MPKPLPSYLRTHRMRSGLTQDEVAYLLGAQSGTKVTRYERRTRLPTLANVFAIQVIYGVTAHELFPGVFAQVRKTVIKRAAVLAIAVKSTDPQAKRKLAALDAIIQCEDVVVARRIR